MSQGHMTVKNNSFFARPISRAAAAIHHKQIDRLYLGNLDARRDWGYAGDYVEAMWRMLQADKPDDYVVATGETHTVRRFCDLAFAEIDLPLTWEGEGESEKGIGPNGQVLIEVDPRYFRPAEVDLLLGDASKAQEKLGSQPKTSFGELVQLMVDHDWSIAKRERVDELIQL